jgi:gliding motility-associated-like protein
MLNYIPYFMMIFKQLHAKFLFLFLCSFLLFFSQASATHIRGGDLTARRLPGAGLTYEFTLTIYRDITGVPADEEVDFDFGDNQTARVRLTSTQDVGNQTQRLLYVTTYTFAGPGEFRVGVGIRNRNPNVLNIPNSVNTPFYIESIFLISPFLGLNSSPILTYPILDFGASRQIFIHNPGAFDPEGDSLSYELTICKRDRNRPIEGYIFPQEVPPAATNRAGTAPATLVLDPLTGDLIWDAPLQPGQYNVAFFVNEWRNGIKISSINRDIQIIIRENPNRPPELMIPMDTCVIAGVNLQRNVIATDPDRDFISLQAFGELFQNRAPGNRATFDTLLSQSTAGRRVGVFRWQTVCSDIRTEPYNVIFRAEDRPTPSINRLVVLRTWRIKVIGPPPTQFVAVANNINRSISLSWANYLCPNATRMLVFRKQGTSGWSPGICETGIPASAGYQQIGDIPIGQTNFVDNNNGMGLRRGVTYCYRIYAVFPDPKGGESIASIEVCSTLQTNAPLITNVSVERTNTTQGEIFVRWVKPIAIDIMRFPRPHTYRVTRAESFSGTTNIRQLPRNFAENDTFFTDTGLNTEGRVYNYRVTFFANGVIVDSSEVASSVRLTAFPASRAIRLQWSAVVPWNNISSRYRRHLIHRERINNRGTFDLIDSVEVSTNGFNYVDLGRFQNQPLQDGVAYCYFVTTRGSYENPNISEPLLNKSQLICAITRDTVPPCPPQATIIPLDCGSFNPRDPSTCSSTYSNRISWRAGRQAGCDTFISGYRIYFKPTEEDSLRVLATVKDTFYVHQNLTSLAGCYAIAALDTAGNEGRQSTVVCNDNCPFYELPNVITPNADSRNDRFRPMTCPRFVEKVVFKVYNRWGGLIYERDDDINLNWAGISQDGNPLPAGLYYYEADVTFIRLRREDNMTRIKGWIQLLRE